MKFLHSFIGDKIKLARREVKMKVGKKRLV
jgi:hypothetical protein